MSPVVRNISRLQLNFQRFYLTHGIPDILIPSKNLILKTVNLLSAMCKQTETSMTSVKCIVHLADIRDIKDSTAKPSAETVSRVMLRMAISSVDRWTDITLKRRRLAFRIGPAKSAWSSGKVFSEDRDYFSVADGTIEDKASAHSTKERCLSNSKNIAASLTSWENTPATPLACDQLITGRSFQLFWRGDNWLRWGRCRLSTDRRGIHRRRKNP